MLVDPDGRLIPPPPFPKAPVEEEVSEANRGALAPQAASILMKLLYAAQICRFDLCTAKHQQLGSQDHQADQERGCTLAPPHGLCAPVQTSHDDWMGGGRLSGLSDTHPWLFADANYEGCGESLKSTSGAHMSYAHSRAAQISFGGSKQEARVPQSFYT